MNWLLNNWDSILELGSAIIAIASIIVKITPNQTDNEILVKILKFFEIIALNNKPVEKKGQ